MIIKSIKKTIRLWCIVAGILTASHFARAADTDSSYSTERPFGVPRSRFNILEPGRTPITEMPTRAVSRHAFIPPRTRRQGFVPRISVMEEYNDNILFDSKTVLKDFVTIISPGFNFLNTSDRGNFELDYSLESAIYPSHSELNDAFEAHNILSSGSFRFSKKTSLSFYENFFSFKDSSRQIIPGLAARSRVNENYFNLGLTHILSPKTKVHANYKQDLNQYDDEDAITSLIHEGSLALSNQFTHQDKASIKYRYRLLNFESRTNTDSDVDSDGNTLSTTPITSNVGQDGMIHLISINNIHEFSESLIATTEVGAAQTTEPHNATDIIGRASIQASTKDTSAELSYERDITTTGGFGTLMKVDTVSANVGASLINKLYGSLSLDFLRLKQVSGEGIDVKILEPTASLEYKISKHFQVRFSYKYLYQEINIDKSTTDSNRVNLGFDASF